MRPATLILIATGGVLVLGMLLVASFVLPWRSEEVRGTGGYLSIFDQNIYGQSLAVRQR